MAGAGSDAAGRLLGSNGGEAENAGKEYLTQIEAENDDLKTKLAENAQYIEQLQMFKKMIPSIGLGPMSQIEVRTLGIQCPTSHLEWHAVICAELTEIFKQNETLLKKCQTDQSCARD